MRFAAQPGLSAQQGTARSQDIPVAGGLVTAVTLPLVLGALLGAFAAARLQWPQVAMAAEVGRKVPRPEEIEFDVAAVGRYLGATALQWGLILCTLSFLDRANNYLVATAGAPGWVPTAVVVLFFLFTAVRSRVFSPLDNSRPTLTKERAAIDELRRPSWMPPPIVFPIVWSSIAILRTVAGYLVWQQLGYTLLAPPVMVYFLSLCIGDTWNTIQNVEKRPGMAVVGVAFVWLAAIATNYVYFEALPLAGQVLAPQSVWLTIAAVLIYSIWRINGSEPLYPYKWKA